MPQLTDRELVALVENEFTRSMGAPGGEISKERALAWDFYLSKKLGNEIEGESQVVTSDVSDVVDSIMPNMLRLFTTADNLVSFDAVGPEDEETAAQESDYVNYVFFKRNPAFLILYTWFFDALVQKNGIVKAWWDESEIVTTETYKDLTDDELFSLVEDDELEAVERSERIGTVPTEMGEVEATLHTVKFLRTSKQGRVRVENVPPEEYRISADCRSLDPSSARMVGHERLVKRYELLEMGFDADVVDSLPAHGDLNNEEQLARYQQGDEAITQAEDRSQDEILLREAYVMVDYEGNGKAQLRQVFIAENTLLSNEDQDRQPFHVISPQPLPHKHFGRATAEKVMDNQEITTTLLRQILNNLYHSNQPGHAVWEQGLGENTMDELLTTRVGRVVTFARPVTDSYAPMKVEFTGDASFPMLEFFDKVKRDRTGISSNAEGLTPEALKNIQTSVLTQAVDLSKMKIEAIARVFAETGLKSLFLHIHELLQKHQQKDVVVKLRNRWVNVDPQSWRTRLDMTVNIGLGIGTREQNLLHLDAIWQKQREMVEGGGMNLMVTPDNIYTTAVEIVKNANYKQPEMFFTDPQGKPAPPPSDEQQELQKQQMQVQARQQELDAERQAVAQAKLELQQREMQLDHQVDMLELERKREADKDRFHVENEKLRNALIEMELKYNERSESK